MGTPRPFRGEVKAGRRGWRLAALVLGLALMTCRAALGEPADSDLAADANAPALAPCAFPDPSDETPASETAPPDSAPGIGTIALQDTIHILGGPLHWTTKDWLIATGTLAGVVAVGFAFDIPMRNKTQSHQTDTLDELTKVVEPFGAGYSWAVIGAYGIAGFVFHDADSRNIAVDSVMASILASGIITPTLKFVIGRARPNQNEGSTSFHPFDTSDASFPSGHATQAFAVASVISASSDKVWVSVAAYTVAGLVGFARIYHDAHWTSDVTAGAIIGTVVGRGIVFLNRRLRAGEGKVKVAVVPLVGDRMRGGALAFEF